MYVQLILTFLQLLWEMATCQTGLRIKGFYNQKMNELEPIGQVAVKLSLDGVIANSDSTRPTVPSTSFSFDAREW